MIPKEIIDEIFSTAQIEEVIGEFVQLKRAGSNLKGLSPFVDEKTPSFIVSPAKQIFKDFSSGKGGNVVSFLMEHDAMSYPEALRWLANKYNIEIPEKEETPEELAQRTEREALFIINDFAQTHFEENLWENNDGRAIGLSYFRERGFSDDTIKEFHLGYCLESNKFSEVAVKEGYSAELLLKLGLIKENDKGHFDFYRGRVMFPIHNLTGRVVGFGGRTLKQGKKVAKYFNSPESEIYNKSRVLYGLYQSRSEIVKNDMCNLVEGYTDVISLHQAGIKNVVSSSGTALTVDQIKLISRYTKNVTILYDGDAAGIKASFRGIDMILEHGLNVRVVLFPEGDDPDSFAKQHTKEEITDYLKDHSQDFITYKAEVLLEEAQGDPVQKAKLIKDILQSIALIPDQITRSVMVKTCAERFEMDERSLLHEMDKLRKKESDNKRKQVVDTSMPEPVTPVQIQKRDEKVTFIDQEKDLIRIMLNYGHNEIEVAWEDEDGGKQEETIKVVPYIIEQIEMDGLRLREPILSDMYQEFVQWNDKDDIPGPEHFYTHRDPQVSSVAVDLCSSPYNLSENWWEMHNIDTREEKDKLIDSVQSAVHSFKMKALDKMIIDSQEQLKETKDDQKLMELMHEQAGLIKVRQTLANRLGRTILK